MVDYLAYALSATALIKDTRCIICSELRQRLGGGVFVEYIGNVVMGFEADFRCKGAWFYLGCVVD